MDASEADELDRRVFSIASIAFSSWLISTIGLSMMTADSWRVGIRERNLLVGRLAIFEVRRALGTSIDREMSMR